MPSPVGHTLLGLAVGLLARPRRGGAETVRRDAGILAAAVVVANLPDLDYIPGMLAGHLNAYHHGYTHTLGWIAVAAAGLALAARALRAAAGWGTFAWCFGLLASHLAADWLTEDRRPPFGIMAFWPFDRAYHAAAHPIFLHLRKSTYAEFVQPHNFAAVGVEILWCLPLVLLAWWARPSRSPKQTPLQPRPPARRGPGRRTEGRTSR